MIKRIQGVVTIAAFLFILSGGVAYAGYGVHATVDGSDICPVCHEHSPVGDVFQSHETIEYDFCTTCHGISAAGADTDVVNGVYDNPSGQNGTFGSVLNSGGFEKIGGVLGNATTSTHSVDGSPQPIFGSSTGNTISLSCTSCHDPDGSSNYRILKDLVNGKNVANYVTSNETGFSDSLSEDPNVYQNYDPNYTAPNYKTPTESARGIGGWCASCHDNYKSSNVEIDAKGKKHFYYIGADGKKRYHHAINAPIGNNPTGNTTTDLPLEKNSAATPDNDPGNYVMCLTCHRVHGTDSTMTDNAKVGPAQGSPASGQSTLLRLNNRGVCQNCHPDLTSN